MSECQLDNVGIIATTSHLYLVPTLKGRALKRVLFIQPKRMDRHRAYQAGLLAALYA
jgi:hypothetical protein